MPDGTRHGRTAGRGPNDPPPLRITDAARDWLARELAPATPDVCFRMRPSSDGVVAAIGRATASDELVQHRGRVILAIAPELATRLDGRTLDVERARGREALIVL